MNRNRNVRRSSSRDHQPLKQRELELVELEPRKLFSGTAAPVEVDEVDAPAEPQQSSQSPAPIDPSASGQTSTGPNPPGNSSSPSQDANVQADGAADANVQADQSSGPADAGISPDQASDLQGIQPASVTVTGDVTLNSDSLTVDQVNAAFAQASSILADAGVLADVTQSQLASIQIMIADSDALGGGIAASSDGRITLHHDATIGWHAPPDASDTGMSPFTPISSSILVADDEHPAKDRMDLVTVMMRQIVAVLGCDGLANGDNDLMGSHINPGERRLPVLDYAYFDSGAQQVSPTLSVNPKPFTGGAAVTTFYRDDAAAAVSASNADGLPSVVRADIRIGDVRGVVEIETVLSDDLDAQLDANYRPTSQSAWNGLRADGSLGADLTIGRFNQIGDYAYVKYNFSFDRSLSADHFFARIEPFVNPYVGGWSAVTLNGDGFVGGGSLDSTIEDRIRLYHDRYDSGLMLSDCVADIPGGAYAVYLGDELIEIDGPTIGIDSPDLSDWITTFQTGTPIRGFTVYTGVTVVDSNRQIELSSRISKIGWDAVSITQQDLGSQTVKVTASGAADATYHVSSTWTTGSQIAFVKPLDGADYRHTDEGSPVEVVGQDGTLLISTDGSFQYVPSNVTQSILHSGQTVTDTFIYQNDLGQQGTIEIEITGDAYYHPSSVDVDPTLAQPGLTADQVKDMYDAAVLRLYDSKTITADQLGALLKVEIEVTALDGINQLAELDGDGDGMVLRLDHNAAGFGWFVDHTPFDDSGDVEGVDLLTVLMREMGHILGHDSGGGHGTLGFGERQVPDSFEAGSSPVGGVLSLAVDPVTVTFDVDSPGAGVDPNAALSQAIQNTYTAGVLWMLDMGAITSAQAMDLLDDEVSIVVKDLDGQFLAEIDGSTIYLDLDAAGHDWFLDRTPFEDSDAIKGIDLLTVLMREMGQLLGHNGEQVDGGLMYEYLKVGDRDFPDEGQFTSLTGSEELTISTLSAAPVNSSGSASAGFSGPADGVPAHTATADPGETSFTVDFSLRGVTGTLTVRLVSHGDIELNAEYYNYFRAWSNGNGGRVVRDLSVLIDLAGGIGDYGYLELDFLFSHSAERGRFWADLDFPKSPDAYTWMIGIYNGGNSINAEFERAIAEFHQDFEPGMTLSEWIESSGSNDYPDSTDYSHLIGLARIYDAYRLSETGMGSDRARFGGKHFPGPSDVHQMTFFIGCTGLQDGGKPLELTAGVNSVGLYSRPISGAGWDSVAVMSDQNGSSQFDASPNDASGGLIKSVGTSWIVSDHQTVSGSTSIVGQHGTLTINEDGTFTYATNSMTQRLQRGTYAWDFFNYTNEFGERSGIQIRILGLYDEPPDGPPGPTFVGVSLREVMKWEEDTRREFHEYVASLFEISPLAEEAGIPESDQPLSRDIYDRDIYDRIVDSGELRWGREFAGSSVFSDSAASVSEWMELAEQVETEADQTADSFTVIEADPYQQFSESFSVVVPALSLYAEVEIDMSPKQVSETETRYRMTLRLLFQDGVGVAEEELEELRYLLLPDGVSPPENAEDWAVAYKDEGSLTFVGVCHSEFWSSEETIIVWLHFGSDLLDTRYRAHFVVDTPNRKIQAMDLNPQVFVSRPNRMSEDTETEEFGSQRFYMRKR